MAATSQPLLDEKLPQGNSIQGGLQAGPTLSLGENPPMVSEGPQSVKPFPVSRMFSLLAFGFAFGEMMSITAYIKRQTNHRPAFDSGLCPPEAAARVGRCWHMDPMRRPTMEEVVQEWHKQGLQNSEAGVEMVTTCKHTVESCI